MKVAVGIYYCEENDVTCFTADLSKVKTDVLRETIMDAAGKKLDCQLSFDEISEIVDAEITEYPVDIVGCVVIWQHDY